MKRVEDRWKCICKISLQILIYTVLILISPLIILILLSLCLYKYGILRLIVKYFKPKLLEELNEHDAFYAHSDRFWENSSASYGLMLVLNGNASLEQIRQDFFNTVILAKSASGCTLFPRLTQIPQSFGGYYYWAKANYFLIHEHIRHIDTPTDEGGLKKFAGTVLTLPFPNKRPLWEILVFSSYSYNNKSQTVAEMSKEVKIEEEDFISVSPKCSAFVIRIHSAIGDHDLMMRMVGLLCNKNSFSLQSLQLPDCVGVNINTNNANDNELLKSGLKASKGGDNQLHPMDRIRTLLKTPRNVHTFLQSFLLNRSCSSLNSLYSCGINNTSTVSWTTLSYPQISKIVDVHGVDWSAVLVSVLLGALTSPKDGLVVLQTQLENKPDTDCDEMNREKDKTTAMSMSILCSLKRSHHSSDEEDYYDGFTFLRSVQDNSSKSITRLQNINGQLVSAISESNQSSISIRFLKFLTIFPHPIVRHVNFHWLKGATMIFQECKSDISHILRQVQPQSSRRISAIPNDLIFIGDHQLLDVTPLCGLHFRHSVIAATAMKFQNTLKISVTINSGLLPEISTVYRPSSISANQIIDKQTKVDNIVHNLGNQVDKIFEDGKDDHGFVRIPIM